jgi:hypothetical protein
MNPFNNAASSIQIGAVLVADDEEQERRQDPACAAK